MEASYWLFVNMCWLLDSVQSWILLLVLPSMLLLLFVEGLFGVSFGFLYWLFCWVINLVCITLNLGLFAGYLRDFTVGFVIVMSLVFI